MTAASGHVLPGYVLAGGRSARMGRDKAFFPVQDEPMALRVAAALTRGGAAPVHIVGKDPTLAELGLPWLSDDQPTFHPLVGVVAALRHARSLGQPLAILAPCDLPWLSAQATARLLKHGGPCTAWDGDNAQPLLCVLSIDSLPSLQDHLKRQASVRAALAELPRVQVPRGTLQNVNRATDLDPPT